MSAYIATFHTHLAALLTSRALGQADIPSRMAPVPRKLSSSCGTCVFYTAPEPRRDCLDQDTERVYRLDGDGYRMVLDLEA